MAIFGHKMMIEIRLGRNVDIRRNLVNESIDAGLWRPDTPENRRDLEIIMEAANKAYGEGSYWIEAREA